VGAERNEAAGDHGGEAGPGTEGIIHKNGSVRRGYSAPLTDSGIRRRLEGKTPGKPKDPARTPFHPVFGAV
jgi:hypothetical protein